MLPKLISYEGASTTGFEKFTAIAGNTDFVIVGGTTNRGSLASHTYGNAELPMLTRMDLASRLYRWGKVLSTGGMSSKVESLTLSPNLATDGYLFAAFTSQFSDDAVGNKFFFITIYSASDGGIRTSTQKLKTYGATAGGVTHRISGSNVFFSSSKQVIFGMEFFCPGFTTTCLY